MMTSPMPRNTRDWNLTTDGSGEPFKQHNHCNPPNGAGVGTPREETGSGQPCLWFSQGGVLQLSDALPNRSLARAVHVRRMHDRLQYL